MKLGINLLGWKLFSIMENGNSKASITEFNQILRNKFLSKLTQVLQKYEEDACVLNHIWCLNQITVPFNSGVNQCGNLKIKYGHPENEFMNYSTLAGKSELVFKILIGLKENFSQN